MENSLDNELKAHLMQTDPHFREVCEKHAAYERQIEQIEAKSHVTPDDELEEQRLKKLKLACKDEMQQIMQRNRQTAAV